MISNEFSTESLPLTGSPLVGALVKEYLKGSQSVRGLFGPPPNDAGLKDFFSIKQKTLPHRPLLHSVLSGQYQVLEDLGEPISPEVKNNLKSLLSDSTFTVTTGHQLQLAGGPLFFAFKILTAVAAARHFQNSNPSIQVVPVFWLASEDHDMDEINHLHVNGEKLVWNTEWKGPSGKAMCDGVEVMLSELKLKVGEIPFATELIADLDASYKSGRDLSLATRILVNRWFGRFGVVALDASDANLKRIFSPAISKELFTSNTSQLVNSVIGNFPEGIDAQVNPREINLFYMMGESRQRIVREGDDWKVLGGETRFDRATLQGELDAHPERFSPNVLLRPLYQETLLPDLAYIGGPSEIAYWLELKALFEDHQVDFPMLLLRDFFLHLDAGTRRRMDKTGLSLNDLWNTPDEWLKKRVEQRIHATDPFENAKSTLTDTFESLKPFVIATDTSLSGSIQAELQKSLNGLDNLKEKWMRAEKRKMEDMKSHFNKIHEAVFPGGTFQERTLSLVGVLAKNGSSMPE
ncbi:MAG: bacillithiol biosynthesis cysteine-adding enzyme BshC, partial [Bacteroidota bacterium]